MKCNYCGADNKEDSKFCASCGAELKEKKKTTKKEEVKEEKVEVKTEPVKTTVTPVKTTDGKATASLVLGICSLIVWCLTLPLSIVGLILGIVSKERSGKRTAGIVINAITLVLSLICVVFCFWFGAVINAAVDEFNRSGDFNRFFDIIEEELEKEYDNEYTIDDKDEEKEEEKKPAENTMVIGDDHFGYVTVPSNWHKFVDVDGNSTFQYSDIGDLGYIVTLQTYEEDITPIQAAMNVANHIKSEGEEATYKYTKIAKYYGYVVNAKYADGTYLDAYLFKADDGKLHYVAIEGPDNTNDNFKIPDTFSITK